MLTPTLTSTLTLTLNLNPDPDPATYQVTNETSVHMIDFARSYRTEQRLSHRAAWQPGNHEDGFLTGLDNLVRILEEAADDVCEDSSPWRSALKRRVLPEVLKDV